MAYVPVPKDLTRVKTKFLFNLTKRQVICFGLGALAGVPLFFLTKNVLGASMATLLMIAVMLPFFMFAMFERHGQPLEKLLRQYMQARYGRPRTRVYQTDKTLFISLPPFISCLIREKESQWHSFSRI